MIEVNMSPALPFACDQTERASSHLFNSGSHKTHTEMSRHLAVEQAIAMMRSHFQDPLTLPEIASSVQLSPFHFNRIFRSITGVPPSVYLAALRIEQAKKLLLRTKLSVTSVCFDVGYNSLGTFTTRFTKFVGTTPSQLRQFSQSEELQTLFQNWEFLKACLSVFERREGNITIKGYIDLPLPFDGLIFVGLFTDPIPQGAPISCTVLAEPGTYTLGPVPDGAYYLFATALQRSENPVEILEASSSLRCVNQHPISICRGKTYKIIDLSLSPMYWTDAPILIALPWFLASHLAESASVLSLC
jgi:AraC-like DNA-binding protein